MKDTLNASAERIRDLDLNWRRNQNISNREENHVETSRRCREHTESPDRFGQKDETMMQIVDSSKRGEGKKRASKSIS